MTPEEQGQSQEEKPSFEQFSKSASLRKRLMEELEAAAQGQGTDLGDKRKKIAEKRLELFDASHDVTGVWKRERFGRDLAAAYEAKGIENPGVPEITEEDRRTQMLFVNMGELDRLNASGDHALGDAALRRVGEQIERQVRAALGGEAKDADQKALTERYEIYRVGSGDFVVRIKDMDDEQGDVLRQSLCTEVEMDSLHKGEEAVPLVTDRVSQADILDKLHRLVENEEDREAYDKEKNKGRLAISATYEFLQTQNDLSAVKSKLERMVGKIKEARASGNEAQAAEFYEKFYKKALGGMFKLDLPDAPEAADYASFEAQVRGLGAFDEDPSRWIHAVERMAPDEAARLLKGRRLESRAVERSMSELVSREVLQRGLGLGSGTKAWEAPPVSRDFTPPEPSRGRLKVQSLDALAQSAEQTSQASPEDEALAADAEIAKLDFEIQRERHDTLTGLELRGPMFQNMEAGIAEGKAVSMVFIDMGFLKYFDKEGGRKTAELALMKAAEMLDGISKEYQERGIQVSAYRFGGDEFALNVVGGDEAALEEIVLKLRQVEVAAGEIPPQGPPVGTYAPMRMSFNYGVRHAQNKEALRAFLKEQGLPLKEEGKPKENNELADYLVRIADKEVEIQKGMNRMHLLLREQKKAAESGDRSQYEQLLKYSAKGILEDDKKTSEKKLEELGQRLRDNPDSEEVRASVDRDIQTFMLERIAQKNKGKEGYETSMDRIIEDAVRLRYYVMREQELEGRVTELTKKLIADDAKIDDLQKALKIVRAEQEAVVSLRQQIKG